MNKNREDVKSNHVRKLIEEIIYYVHEDLFQRNASRVLPSFSRSNLFVKPQNWKGFFDHSTQKNTALQTIEDLISGKASIKSTVPPLEFVINRAQISLLAKQDKKGYWSSPLRADTTLESDMITLYAFMGWLESKKDKVRKFANFILSRQQADGGWNIYTNGPSEISATVKAYWALKIAGHTADQPYMQKAKEKITALGGIHAVNTYSKFYMALFGIYDWKGAPAIPPELMLFPKWFYFNIYEMSSWTRAIVIPLSIVWAKKKKSKVVLPKNAQLDELFDSNQPRWVPLGNLKAKQEGFFSWRKFFLWWDGFFKLMEGNGPHFLRTWSLKLASKWMIEHFKNSEGLAAIFPAMVNAIMALRLLGYQDTHPYVQGQLKELEAFELDYPEEDQLEMQPCVSPLWDSAIAMIALAESGIKRDHPQLVKACHFLVENEIRRAGDWKIKNPSGPIGGWAFEFKNDFYPDVDDTAMILLALRLVHISDDKKAQEREKAYLRGLNWMLSMQCSNGGWAAFDLDNTKSIFEKIPFADHNAMIDPPSVDITGRVLESLGHVGYDVSYSCVQRALKYIKSEQEEDGSWYGRWGVNYIYGTWQVLRGLEAIGETMQSAYVQKSCHWLKSIQNEDGGWGERCNTYDDSSYKGLGPSTPSQSAWGLMGLMACGLLEDSAIKKSVSYLLSKQKKDGTWDEPEFTGTGFPKVFYLEYTLYRDYFPLLALGIYHNRMQAKQVKNKS